MNVMLLKLNQYCLCNNVNVSDVEFGWDKVLSNDKLAVVFFDDVIICWLCFFVGVP